MKRLIQKHVNLNSFLLMALLGLLKFETSRLIDKIDALDAGQDALAERVARLEGAVGLTVPLPTPKPKP